MHLLNDRSALWAPEGAGLGTESAARSQERYGWKGCITSSPDQAIPFLAHALLERLEINEAAAAVRQVEHLGNVYRQGNETIGEYETDAATDLGETMARMDIPFTKEFFDKLVKEVSENNPSYARADGMSEAPALEFVLQNLGGQSALLTDIGIKIVSTMEPPELGEGDSSPLDGARILPVVAKANIIVEGSSRGARFKLDDPVVIPPRGFARLKVTLKFDKIDGVGVGGWSARLTFLGGDTELGSTNEICYVERLTMFQ